MSGTGGRDGGNDFQAGKRNARRNLASSSMLSVEYIASGNFPRGNIASGNFPGDNIASGNLPAFGAAVSAATSGTDVTKRKPPSGKRREATKWTLPLVEAKPPNVTTSSDMSSGVDAEITLSCPMCWEAYSDDRFPVMLMGCGHSVCKICHAQGAPCTTCGRPTMRIHDGKQNRTRALKNFGMLDVVNLHHASQGKFAEEKTRFETTHRQMTSELEELRAFKVQREREETARKEMYMECAECNILEKNERMSICQSCTGMGNVDWAGIGEEEVHPFILCAHCLLYRDEHNGHICRNYLQWKLKKLFTSTISDGQAMVASMDEVCAYEIEKGKERLEKWNEAMQVFDSIEEHVAYEEGLMLGDALKKEADIVCTASEETLFPLRKFTKMLTDSTTRLEQWIEAVRERKPVTSELLEGKLPVSGGVAIRTSSASDESTHSSDSTLDTVGGVLQSASTSRPPDWEKEEESVIPKWKGKGFKSTVYTTLDDDRSVQKKAGDGSSFSSPCYKCREYGHASSVCTNGYVPFCGKCNRPGHLQGSCPNSSNGAAHVPVSTRPANVENTVLSFGLGHSNEDW